MHLAEAPFSGKRQTRLTLHFSSIFMATSLFSFLLACMIAATALPTPAMFPALLVVADDDDGNRELSNSNSLGSTDNVNIFYTSDDPQTRNKRIRPLMLGNGRFADDLSSPYYGYFNNFHQPKPTDASFYHNLYRTQAQPHGLRRQVRSPFLFPTATRYYSRGLRSAAPAQMTAGGIGSSAVGTSVMIERPQMQGSEPDWLLFQNF